MKNKKGLGKFVLGLGIGAGLGILFAPKKGSETRKDLKIKIDELMEKLKNVSLNDVKENIEAKIFAIKASLADLDKEKVLKFAKKKASDIKDMAAELVDYAVKKGTPVLEEAASAVRDKAIDVTKEILKKLEAKKTTEK
jgi:gas vesicle protein